MELLLLSNSTLPGKAWLEHALPLIAEQLQGRRSAVFIPFAGVTQTWDDYTAKTAAVLAPLGVSVTGIHSVVDPVAAIENAEIVIVGWHQLLTWLNVALCILAGAQALTLLAQPFVPPTICRLSIRKVSMR